MAFDYAELRDTASELIEEFGQAAHIRRITLGAGPAHNPGPGTPADYPVTLVEVSASQVERDGTKIKAGDRGFMLSVESLAIEPSTSDKVVLAGKTWSIMKADPLNPGGMVLIYMVHARG